VDVQRHADGVLALWLDRPQKRNAIDTPLVTALIRAVEEAGDEVIVLASRDPRAFCAGVDLSLTDAERAEVSDRLYALYHLLLTRRAPVVAAVGGPAVGGGAQLAIAADLRVIGPSAVFRFAGPGHGLAVGAWGLPSLVGRGRALDLCLTMRDVGAEEALAIGLADRVSDDVVTEALTIAASLAALDRAAVTRVRDMSQETFDLVAALDRERAGNRAAWSGSVDGLRPRGASATSPREPT
jgi:enoyl-CoA hydratase/carnithine racemase